MLATDHALTIHLIKILPVLAIGFISFISLGLALGTKLAQHKKLSDYLIVIFAYAFAALLGYINFYIYLGSARIGSDVETALILLNVLSLVFLLASKNLRKIVLRKTVWFPMVLILLVGTLYIGVMDSCTVHLPQQKEYYCLLPDTSQPSQVSQQKIVFNTFDNLIPYYFAQNLQSGHARASYGDWKSSDRPPLQTGMYLSYNSLINHFTDDTFSSYLMLSMLFQLAFIPAVWALMKVLKCSDWQVSIVLFAMIFTDFIFNNSYFTWPKLLAAGLFLLGFSLLLEKKPLTVTRSLIIGSALALSYLAHSAVAFSLVPLFIFVIPRIKTIFRPKYLVLILAAVVILIAPWSAYQKYYDPPGNRLLKWQFAGDITIDNNTVTHDILHAYEALTPKTYLDNKFKNVEMILGTLPMHDSGFRKDRQVETLTGSGGLLILSLVGLVFIRRRANRQALKNIKSLSFYLLTTLAVWALLMFIPASTTLHQGSYVVPLLFITVLGISASLLPKLVTVGLLLGQVILFMLTWVFDKGLYVSTTHAIFNTYALFVIVVLILAISGLLFLPLIKSRLTNLSLKRID